MKLLLHFIFYQFILVDIAGPLSVSFNQGIDMKTKGAAAEITEDAGLLKNYIEPKGKKGEKKKRARKPKKTKAKNELRPDLNRDVKKGEGDKTKDGVESGSPPDINERARQGIGQAQSRRTPTARTPVHMSKLVYSLHAFCNAEYFTAYFRT